MKPFFLLPAAVLLAIIPTACNKSEAAGAGSDSGKPLSFNTYVSETKATQLTSESITDFGVYAYYTQANAWSNSARPNFMYNQLVSGSRGSGFSYTPVKYWPALKNAKISFFAYAPYGTAENGISPRSTNTDSGVPDIVLASPDGSCNFPDLVVAEPVYNAGLQETGGSIMFQFHHTLSKISFQARLAGSDEGYDNTSIYLNSLLLSAEYPVSGVLDLGSGSWSNVEPGRRLVMSKYIGTGDNGLLLSSTRQAAGDDYCILTIPDNRKEYILSVSYTVITPDEALPGGKLSNSYTVNQSFSFETEKGKAYDILISVSPSAITFGEPEVSAWNVSPEEPGDFIL